MQSRSTSTFSIPYWVSLINCHEPYIFPKVPYPPDICIFQKKVLFMDGYIFKLKNIFSASEDVIHYTTDHPIQASYFFKCLLAFFVQS
jgi:hypothetical protein